MTRRLLPLSALLAAFAIGAAACGGDSGSATTQATETTTEMSHSDMNATETTTTETTTTETTPLVKTITIAAEDGKVVGGFVRETIDQGARVVLVVTWDEAGALHLHGYEKAVKLRPGVPGRIAFDASLPGRFEVELHGDRELQIAELKVTP